METINNRENNNIEVILSAKDLLNMIKYYNDIANITAIENVEEGDELYKYLMLN